jgi:hypothetical protein
MVIPLSFPHELLMMYFIVENVFIIETYDYNAWYSYNWEVQLTF